MSGMLERLDMKEIIDILKSMDVIPQESLATGEHRNPSLDLDHGLNETLGDLHKNIFGTLENAKIGISVIGRDNLVLYQNETVKRDFGDVVGCICYSAFADSSEPCPSCPVYECMDEGRVRTGYMLTKSQKKMELIAVPFPIGGPADRAIVVMIDTAYRFKAEDAAQESEEKYRCLFESSIEGVCVARGYQIVSANRSALDILGYETLEELAKISLLDHVAPECRHTIEDRRVKRAQGKELSTSLDIRVLCKDRRKKHIEVSTTTLMIGNETYTMASFRDITERTRMERALRKSEEKYRTLAENINVGVYRNAGFDGRFIEVNPAMLRIFGYETKEEFMERNIIELFQYVPDCIRLICQMEQNGFVKDEELRLKKKDGTPFFASMSAVAVTDSMGIFKHFDGIVEDITERKRAEQELRESEEKYRNILESIEDGYFEVDLAGNFVFFNDSLSHILGYSGAELEGMNYRELLDEKTGRAVYEGFNRVLTGKTSERALDWEVTRGDGEKRSIEASMSLIRDSEGDPVGFRGIARDVTERKEAERELTLLSTAVKMSNECILITDATGKIVDANDATLKLYGGLQKGDLLDKNGLIFVAPEDRRKVQAAFNEMLEDEFQGTHEFDVILRNENRITLETNITILKDDQGAIKGVIITARDITERKKAERNMKRRLMKYDLEEGNLYSYQEDAPEITLEAFKDLLKVGYHGLIISRDPRARFENRIENGFDYLWLAERNHEAVMTHNLEDIKKRIGSLRTASTVLIDRVDYLIFKNGFEKTFSLVCDLREMAYLHNHVIIFSVDPSTMAEKELKQFMKETMKIVSIEKEEIPENLFEFLRAIRRENIVGKNPSYTEAGEKVGVSKPTARRRIRILLNRGYLRELKRGRKKVLELTEKARATLGIPIP
ncbi:MAG: PAS domain S-box protein [Theionarchaea archaeon]|nr:PAS domain S-box protein [Theionarchaea archaeon]MBU7037374.1 PAS domain S-box protein [Theionarchaea archaeon]